MSMSAWARYYVDRGLRPIRIKSNTKFPVDKGWKDHDFPPEHQLVDEFWVNFNIGLAMGRGLIALDIDCKVQNQLVASGYDTLSRLEQMHGALSQTRRHRTPSGGAHLFFKVPEGFKAANTRKRLGHAVWAGTRIEQTGIDIRAYGGQVVAPPSVIDGRQYEIIDDAEIAFIPEWLLALIPRKIEPQHAAIEHSYKGEIDAIANVAVVTSVFEKEPGLPEGARNNRAFELGCIGRERGLSAEKTAQLLHIIWNVKNQPQMEWPELYTSVVNAFRYSKNQAGAKDPSQEFSARPTIAEIGGSPRGSPTTANDTLVYQNGYALNLRWAETIEATPVSWLWDDKIARGKLNILAGDPGQGKSTIAVDMAAHVSTGTRWCDGAPCKQGTVLVFNCEDAAEDTIKPRLIAAGADMNKVAIVSGVPKEKAPGAPQVEVMFNLQHHIPFLQQTLYTLRQQGHDVVLLTIDPLSAYLGDRDSYKDSEIRALLAPVARLAEDNDIAVVAIHHFKKGRGGGSLNRLAGTIAFGAAARAVWMVMRDADDETGKRFLMLPSKVTNAPQNSGLSYNIEERYVHEKGKSCEIKTSCIKWLMDKPIDKHADEALIEADEMRDGRRQKSHQRMRDLQNWLRSTLRYGPENIQTVVSQAIAEGFTRKTIYDAAKSMKLKDEKGQWSLLDEFKSVRYQL